MSLFGWLTGGTDTAKKVVKAAINTGDALFYTDEEKARDASSYREWYLKYLEATQPQNVARRMIALIVTLMWALVIVLALLVKAWGQPELADYYFKVLDQLVTTPFITIIGFYFLKRIIPKGNDSK